MRASPDQVWPSKPNVERSKFQIASFVMHLRRALAHGIALVRRVLANVVNDDARAASRAWLQAMDLAFPGTTSTWQTPPVDWQAPFERALLDLDGLMPPAKKIFIQCPDRAVRADGVLTVTEAELLRVVCASLHCPLPPLKLGQEA